MYHKILKSEKACLMHTDLRELCGESRVFNYGALIICRSGEMQLSIDFKQYHLSAGAVIILFPSDMVHVDSMTDDFEVEMLRYDKTLLREASLQMEQTVYSRLRKDRFMGGEQVLLDIFEAIFALLRLHFRQEDCQCMDQLVMYQLKSFFLGFYDYVKRHGGVSSEDAGSQRANELFTLFMEALERDYKRSHDVFHYATILNITPKYLYNVSMEVSGQSPKTIIDYYLTMRIKLQLRTSDISIKELAWEYHFSDVSFFCRHFRKCTGMTPQEYRKKYREE